MVILVDAHTRHDWLLKAINRRIREEIAKLGIQVNEQKSRMVDLEREETFTFLGFDFRRIRSYRGVWRPQYTPTRHKCTELRQKIREVFPAPPLTAGAASHPGEVNPILAGWLNYCVSRGHARRREVVSV